MENASQALIIGFSIIIFVIALTISITMFSLVRSTSDFVIFKSDETNYYTYDMVDEDSKRIREVGLETIIPTLYRYYKENYRVEFINSEEKPLEMYESDVTGEEINYFDVDAEVDRNETWIGSQEEFKKNIDNIVEEVLIPTYSDKKFEEIYSTRIDTQDTEAKEEEKEKIVITYKLIN